MKKLTKKQIEDIENEVILLLLCSLEGNIVDDYCKWNCYDPYYCEAFGVMRCLVVLGYSKFETFNTPKTIDNVYLWFGELKIKTDKIIKDMGYRNAKAFYNEKMNNQRKSVLYK